MSPRVIFQMPSRLACEAFNTGGTPKGLKGGNAYEIQAMRALTRRFDVATDPAAIRERESALTYALRLQRRRPRADLLIKNGQAVVWGPLGIAPVEVGIIHHLDWQLARSSLAWRWYFASLVRRLKRLSAVVTVSEFWRQELLRLGVRNVHLIYNSFDLAEFEFAPGEVEAVVRKHGLPTDRPLVYIGNASRHKGVEEVYRALRDSPYTLYMTGHDPDTDIPVPCFNVDRRDYLCLLRASSLVLTMSLMLEGWNRVAHEAMLCGTPVIGSGSGGMRELLVSGGQIVHPGGAGLAEVTAAALVRRDELSAAGRAYAARLNMDYFTTAWIGFVDNIMSAGAQ